MQYRACCTTCCPPSKPEIQVVELQLDIIIIIIIMQLQLSLKLHAHNALRSVSAAHYGRFIGSSSLSAFHLI